MMLAVAVADDTELAVDPFQHGNGLDNSLLGHGMAAVSISLWVWTGETGRASERAWRGDNKICLCRLGPRRIRDTLTRTRGLSAGPSSRT
jgi:hypothetical protein